MNMDMKRYWAGNEGKCGSWLGLGLLSEVGGGRGQEESGNWEAWWGAQYRQ